MRQMRTPKRKEVDATDFVDAYQEVWEVGAETRIEEPSTHFHGMQGHLGQTLPGGQEQLRKHSLSMYSPTMSLLPNKRTFK